MQNNEEEQEQGQPEKEKQQRQQKLLSSSTTSNGLKSKLEHSLERYLPHLKKIVLLALFFAGFAFLYSSIGFLHPEVSHFHEYTTSKLAIEIGGHFLFGFVAAIPFFDLEISLLTGAAAVFIDTDHILSAIGFNVSGRPDHSFLFVFVSAIILFYIVQRQADFSKSFLIKFILFAPVVVFSHIAYDIFAVPLGSSSTFQLFIPFSYAYVTLQYNYWILFEALALALSFSGYVLAIRFSRNGNATKLEVTTATKKTIMSKPNK
jgi:hypothetical protein